MAFKLLVDDLVTSDDLKIISEALFTKHIKPTLNEQEEVLKHFH